MAHFDLPTLSYEYFVKIRTRLSLLLGASGLDPRTWKEHKLANDHRYINSLTLSKPVLAKGYENVAVCESSITYVDGTRGILRYREHDIQQLFHDHDFEDVMHLLIWEKFPTQADRDRVRAELCQAMIPTETVRKVVAAYPRDADVQRILTSAMDAFAVTDEVVSASRQSPTPMFHGHLDVADAAILRALGYHATSIALLYCHRNNKPFYSPEPGRSLIGNLLHMMGVSQVNPKAEECLNKLWVLYADHEMTNSTAAFLHVASSYSDPVSCGNVGITAAFGPLHGGAISLAHKALAKLGDPSTVPAYVEQCKKTKERIFGYGHRLYKTRDPRLGLIEELMEKYQDEVNADPLVSVAAALDKCISQDPYYIERRVHANADLKGCFLYIALGFEPEMTLAITSLARAAGCYAHWRESLTQPTKLWRPLQKYIGPSSNGTA